MDYSGFVDGSFPSQSVLADAERTINYLFEQQAAQGAKSRAILYPTPGFNRFATATTDISGRAAATMNGRTLFVVGFGVYELNSNGVMTRYGSVAQNSSLAQIAFNGTTGNQAAIASGNNEYVLDLTTNTLSGPVANIVNRATMVGMIDGFGITLDADNSRIYVSDVNDFSTVDPTQFAARGDAPDKWRSMLVNPPDIWLIGERTGGVWYDSGAAPFPLAPRSGIQFKYGIVAPFSIAAAGLSVMWLSQTTDGSGVVVRTRGYQPERASNYAIESAIAMYQRVATIADAESLIYQERGHTHYVLTFPSVPASWDYDVEQEKWVELGAWNSTLMRYDRWMPRVHTFAFNKHLVADASTAIVSEMSDEIGTELDGSAIRRLRRAPGVFNEHKRVPVRNIEVYLEAPALTSGQGSNPVISWKTSTNGGRTFGNERIVETGRIGQYLSACMWRFGVPRDMVNEMVVAEPIPYRIVGAYINNR